jgi:hypothetical protein
MITELSCTSEVVIWCYRIFLGRDPEDDLVIQEKLQRIKLFQDLVNEFKTSPEFFSHEAIQRRKLIKPTTEICSWAGQLFNGEELPPPTLQILAGLPSLDDVLQTLQKQKEIQQGRFSIDPDDTCRVILLGNCQIHSLSLLLNCYTNWRVTAWREHTLISKKVQTRILNELKQADIVITQPLSTESFGVLATSYLIDNGVNPVVTPNIYFAGLYPELVYLGTLGHRVRSPIGDYHSAIACAAFLSGLCPEDTLNYFEDDELFEQTGLFDVWDDSWLELISRESKCDVKMADYLIPLSHERPLFYSVNHPIGEVMDELTRRILRLITGQNLVPMLTRDNFHDDVIYPVWGPIIRKHQLHYTTRLGFYRPASKSFLPLSAYLHQVYSRYAKSLRGIELPAIVVHLRNLLTSGYQPKSKGTRPDRHESGPVQSTFPKPSHIFQQLRQWRPFGSS